MQWTQASRKTHVIKKENKAETRFESWRPAAVSTDAQNEYIISNTTFRNTALYSAYTQISMDC